MSDREFVSSELLGSGYLRLKHPDIQFLNREDDLGLEGLRKAKLSYNPHHLVQKHRAYLSEDIHEN